MKDHDQSAHVADATETEAGAPSAAEISRAAWAWRNDKDRETDGSDEAYFRNNWQSLLGLRAYVEAQVELGRALHVAIAKAGTTEQSSRPREAINPPPNLEGK